MAVSAGSPHKRGQLVPSGLLHDHVQRFGMVSGYLFCAFDSRAICVVASMGPYRLGHVCCSLYSESWPTISHSDYINPIDLCNRLNTYIVPEAAVHAFLTFLFLINGYWLALVLNLPLLIFNGKKYVQIDITLEDAGSLFW
jgi:hypothetical protein